MKKTSDILHFGREYDIVFCMEIINSTAGELLHSPVDKVEYLELITSGTVEIVSADQRITAEKGTILGLFETPGDYYTYTYTIKEDCRLERYTFKKLSDTDRIIRDDPSKCDLLVSSNAAVTLSLLGSYKRSLRRCEKQIKTIRDGYKTYLNICAEAGAEVQAWPLAEDLKPFTPEADLPDWVGDYYDHLGLMPAEVKRAYYSTHTSLTTAAIMEAAGHMQLICSLLEQLSIYSNDLLDRYMSSVDLFDLYLNLQNRCSEIPGISTRIDAAVDEYEKQISKAGLLPEDAISRLRTRYTNGVLSSGLIRGDALILDMATDPAFQAKDPVSQGVTPDKKEDADPYLPVRNSLDKILAFSEMDQTEEENIRNEVRLYKTIKDKNSSDDEVRDIRHALSRSFFNLYESITLSIIESHKKPTPAVQMFLYFGFMDEELTGLENSMQLYRILDQIDRDKYATMKVYTLFDWLCLVYHKKRLPSRNEYDQEYNTWLRSMRQSGEINTDQEKKMKDSSKDLMHFEMTNFMKTAMRIASGRPSAFCPALSSHNFVRSPDQTFVPAEKVDDNWKDIKSKDYSLFFREVLYHNDDYRLPNNSILLEVMPDVILLPLTGSRGGLWQETSGTHRDTPARMYMPIFTDEDINLMQLRLAAQFRWQICRRILGAHWDNVLDPSLTGEYSEYLRTFKKNSMLSLEAKEKLRSQIRTCRNSTENVFMLDYIQWIRFEAAGLPRLNKAARRLMFTYCPLTKKVRSELTSNPIYTDLVARQEAEADKNYKRLTSHFSRFKKDGKLPAEIEAYLDYYKN